MTRPGGAPAETPTTPTRERAARGSGGRARALLLRAELLLLGGWLLAGFALSRLSTRVVDWYVMTDELLYERLALSVVHFHSPLPRVHGVLIPNLNQLYPLLLATVYGHGTVPGSLHDAHLLDAFVMTSAAIPAYLLAARTSGSRAVAALVAAGTVAVPWIVYSSFLLTEVVGYPCFLWALLAIQAAVVHPSRRRDALALAGIALAVLARTQFSLLVLVPPLVLATYELALAGEVRGRARLRRAARALRERHALLLWAYAVLAAGLVALLTLGRVSSLLGTYGDTVEGNLVPGGVGRSLLTHMAVMALSTAILPFLVACGWLLASVARPAPDERYAFTLTALVTICALWLEVTVFDLRFGGGIVRDRYLFYVVPLLELACCLGLGARSWPRRAILLPTLLTTGGFLLAGLPDFGTLDVDTPASDVDGYLRSSVHSLEGARLTLAAATLLLAALYLRLSTLLPRRVVSLLVALVLAGALPAETWYAYATLFDHPGTSGRPLTLQQGNVFDWVDQLVGTSPQVTMLPYPFDPGDFQASLAYWWDLEFWNESVGYAAYFPGEFEGTPSTFPPLTLSFNPSTGLADISPSRYVVELGSESRFHIYGTILLYNRGADVIDTGGIWRADWITMGLYDDGWTLPGAVARIRVFPIPFQPRPLLGTVTVRFEEAAVGHPVTLSSNAGRWHGFVPAEGVRVVTIPVCQPAVGSTDVRVEASGQSAIYGDMRNINTFGSYRTAGVLLARIGFSEGTAGCTPRG